MSRGLPLSPRSAQYIVRGVPPAGRADAAEVTHRLNAFLEALAPLVDLPSGGPEPIPAPVDPDGA